MPSVAAQRKIFCDATYINGALGTFEPLQRRDRGRAPARNHRKKNFLKTDSIALLKHGAFRCWRVATARQKIARSRACCSPMPLRCVSNRQLSGNARPFEWIGDRPRKAYQPFLMLHSIEPPRLFPERKFLYVRVVRHFKRSQ
jgi:hypothetical protein